VADSYKELIDALNTHSVITARLMQLLWEREQIMESQRTPVRTSIKTHLLDTTTPFQVLPYDPTRKLVHIKTWAAALIISPRGDINVTRVRSYFGTPPATGGSLNDIMILPSTNYMTFDSTDALWIARYATGTTPRAEVLTTHYAPLPPVSARNVETLGEYATVQKDIDKILSEL
jgi:hypothetical protein